MSKKKTPGGPKRHRLANRPTKTPLIHTQIKEVVVPDPEARAMVKEALELIRKTEARTMALFSRIANLQTDIATLQSRLKSVVQLLVVRDNPDELRENEHIIKQFIGEGDRQQARVRNGPNG